MAGKKGKCPGCGTIMQIPSGNVAAPPPPPPQQAFAFDTPPAAEEEAPVRSPRRASVPGGKKKGLVVAGLGALLLAVVAGGGWAVYALFFAGSADDDFHYLPDNTQGIVRIQLAQLLDSPSFQQIKKEFPAVELADAQAKSKLGLLPQEIETVTIAGGSKGGTTDAVIVLRAKKELDPQTMKQGNEGATYTEEKVGKHVVHKCSEDSNSFCVVTKNLAIGGPSESLKRVLSRDARPKLSDGLTRLLAQVDPAKSISVVVNVQDIDVQDKVTVGGGLSFDARAIKEQVKDVDGLAAQVHFADKIGIHAVLVCKDAPTANRFRKLTEGAPAMAAQFAALPKEITDVLDAVQVVAKDNTMTVDLSFDIGPVLRAAKNMQMPGAGPVPPGP
jgi:ACT domain-containing protein